MNNPITAVLIGAGDRGNVYGQYAFDNPTILNIIAVAEPNKIRRRIFAKKHNILREKSFLDWNELLQQDKLADTAIISTPDRLHFEPARCAMEKGYDVLLEKPMAVKVEKCIALVKLSEKLGKILQICHVLRYTKFFSVIRKTIEDGEIGRIVNISMRENVSYFHYAHSYIRGNWHNRDMSCPMILAKCSHDLDILYWLIDSEPNKISSFGSLTNFGKNNAPKGAATRCTDNCKFKENCLYYAPRIYLDIVPILHIAMKGGSSIEKIISKFGLKYPKLKKLPIFNKINQYSGWPVNVISDDQSYQGKLTELQNGPYGECVYHITDHNVVDHQTVNIEFRNKVTANLTLHGHSHEDGRTIRIDGTKGTIMGNFLLSGQKLEVHNSLQGASKIIHQVRRQEGHGGGDSALIEAFTNLVHFKKENHKLNSYYSPRTSLMSHLMAFAADKARLENTVVNPIDFLC